MIRSQSLKSKYLKNLFQTKIENTIKLKKILRFFKNKIKSTLLLRFFFKSFKTKFKLIKYFLKSSAFLLSLKTINKPSYFKKNKVLTFLNIKRKINMSKKFFFKKFSFKKFSFKKNKKNKKRYSNFFKLKNFQNNNFFFNKNTSKKINTKYFRSYFFFKNEKYSNLKINSFKKIKLLNNTPFFSFEKNYFSYFKERSHINLFNNLSVFYLYSFILSNSDLKKNSRFFTFFKVHSEPLFFNFLFNINLLKNNVFLFFRSKTFSECENFYFKNLNVKVIEKTIDMKKEQKRLIKTKVLLS